jgi:predicted  nucleic acid-binding Zn-ribbon protein
MAYNRDCDLPRPTRISMSPELRFSDRAAARVIDTLATDGLAMVMRTADLWRLQEIDSTLDARRATIDDARSKLGDSEELLAARAEATARSSAQRDAAAAQRDLDLQAEDLKAKIAPAEQKLYSGAIKNPKELQDLQQDIDQLKRQLAAIEDRDIEAMTALETAESEARAAQARVDALDSAWRDEQEELTARIDTLSSELPGLEAEREAVASAIDGGILKVYDHVRRAHQGRGVAKLDRNLCLGCRISLPTSTVNKARAGSALVQCPNCERILCA